MFPLRGYSAQNLRISLAVDSRRLIGLTILMLVIAVYATVAEEEDEARSVESIPHSDLDGQRYEQRQEYRKAS